MTHRGFALSVLFRYIDRSIRSSSAKAADANRGRDTLLWMDSASGPMCDGDKSR